MIPYYMTAFAHSRQIVIARVINDHVASKYIYVRIFWGTEHLHRRTWLSVGTLLAISFGLCVIAWIIAEAIPVFNSLLGLIVRISLLSLLCRR